jgi:chromosome segregation ATPase
MSKQIELEELDRAIKDANIRSGTIRINIEVLDSDISAMEVLEKTLEENIQVLKQKKIVAIAEDYRKAKEDLAKTRVRLITLKNEREDYRKALNNVHQNIKDSAEAIEKIKRDGDNNVLRANFGKKNNG